MLNKIYCFTQFHSPKTVKFMISKTCTKSAIAQLDTKVLDHHFQFVTYRCVTVLDSFYAKDVCGFLPFCQFSFELYRDWQVAFLQETAYPCSSTCSDNVIK